MKKTITLLLGLLYFACMPEENLPIKDMGTTPGYFIECYCQPGKAFSLSAINVLPISGNLQPDFSVDLDISIHAGEPVEMLHGVFTLPGSDFVYNYGSRERLESSGIDTLYLHITTPDERVITAKTSVPQEIRISSATIDNTTASVSFYTSADPTQNYYIIGLQLSRQDSIFKKEITHLDFSSYHTVTSIERQIESPQLKQADRAIITLMRVTQDCYNYQISLHEANSANQGSITTPVPLSGNIQGALGIFTCYTEEVKIIYLPRNK